MIYGVTAPTSGTVRVFGLDVAQNRRAVRSRLGVTLQENVLIPALNAADNLLIFARFHLIGDREARERIEELIDFLQLGSHRDVPVRDLSGGFQRRLAIALSLINRPELVVLDEPTTGLDPAVRLALWSRVRALRNDGSTVLLTTHYMDEAERLCDRVGIIADGKLIAEDAPRALIEKTLAPHTVELDCSVASEAELLDGFGSAPQSLRSGDRLYLHVPDAAPLVRHLEHKLGDRSAQLIARPTTLEDVFLALTGTTLEARA
jgi:lipooligosaccharide transport system ATP-binding protein